MTAELLGLPYSPWTEKARWALDARRVPYAFRHYQPLVGEPALRRKVGRLFGRVSVPVLTSETGQVIEDSAAIARWADARGHGPVLFPSGHDAAIEHFVALSERALDAGRALALLRMLTDAEALAEMLPRRMRAVLGRAGVEVARLGIVRTMRKYGGHRRSREAHRAILVAALDELRERLAGPTQDGPKTLLGRFSFADIAMAQVLINVEPAPELKIGQASRRSFGDPALRDRYRDLLAWRDELRRVYRS